MEVTNHGQFKEWQGSYSAKFTTNRAHVAGPNPDQDGKHPLYRVEQRKHLVFPLSDEFKWVSSSKPVPLPDRRDRAEGKKFIPFKPEDVKDYHERKHMPDRAACTTKTNDVWPFQRQTFATTHNRPSTTEHGVESQMTRKQRVRTMQQQRNSIGCAALGDKVYKAVEYDPGFFREGGLISGSTNALRQRNSGGGKAVDYYSRLKLDGPLNKDSKNYEQVTREQNHKREVGDVKELRQWER